ncbi:hypothetical protein HDA40_002909 [Hamadaea flava]|uniref:FIMAH domain-containing protein n=1 Tax=Hamadaea flava TaxID=1742688 RepID=A0ABV8M1N6_9ACTN|nr:hypothetical protein [Hamadaea flava]MCP2324402.1 hypothetical protein [Hamadaea flava]
MAYDQDPPTQMLPTTQPGRHAAEGSSNRWLFGVIGGAAVLAIVLGILTGLLLSGGTPEPKQPVAGPTVAAEPTEEEVLEPTPEATEISPSPTRKPSPTPAKKTAAQLIAAARDLVASYDRADRIDGEAADTLDGDLRDLARDAASGRNRRAWSDLTDAARHLTRFHQEDQIGDREYQALNAALSEIAKVLPRN